MFLFDDLLINNLLHCKHILHPNDYHNTAPNIMVILLPLGYAGRVSCVTRVYLSDARAEPIIAIREIGQMLWQVADLASPKALVKEKHLENVLLLTIAPGKPYLREADISTFSERHATHSMLRARLTTLGLIHPPTTSTVDPTKFGSMNAPQKNGPHPHDSGQH